MTPLCSRKSGDLQSGATVATILSGYAGGLLWIKSGEDEDYPPIGKIRRLLDETNQLN